MGFEGGQAAGRGLAGLEGWVGILGVEVPVIPATLMWHSEPGSGPQHLKPRCSAHPHSEPRTRACDCPPRTGEEPGREKGTCLSPFTAKS